jgi:hypothetical protein
MPDSDDKPIAPTRDGDAGARGPVVRQALVGVLIGVILLLIVIAGLSVR